MRRRSLLGLAATSWLGACSSSRGRSRAPINAEPLRVGDDLAYLKPAKGEIFAFDPAAHHSNTTAVVAQDFTRILDAKTAWPDLTQTGSRDPYLALLVDNDGPTLPPKQANVVVLSASKLTQVSTMSLGPYERIAIDAELAAVLPAAGDSAPTFGVVDLSIAIQNSKRFAAHSALAIPCEYAGELDIESLAVRTDSSRASWIALATLAGGTVPSRVVLVQAKRATGAQTGLTLGASYEVNLSDSGLPPTRPLGLLFDQVASLLFIWTRGASQLFWLNLAPDGTGTTPALSRLELPSTPSALAMASTGVSQILLGVAPQLDGTTLVSVVDLLTLTTTTLTTPVPADALLVLPTAPGMPDKVVFFAESKLDVPRSSLGIASADALLRSGSQADAVSPISMVPLTQPYEALQRVASDNLLWLGNLDGSASLYNVTEAHFVALEGWAGGARYAGAGTSSDGHLFSEELAPSGGGYLVRPFAKLDGTPFASLRVPARVSQLHQLSSGAYVFVHPGSTGLLTYYDATTVPSNSYCASGFLTDELSP